MLYSSSLGGTSMTHQLLDALVSNGTLSLSNAVDITNGVVQPISTTPIETIEPIQVQLVNPWGF
jgi:hypothetical protein